MKTIRSLCLTALPLVLALPAAAAAQESDPDAAGPAAPPEAAPREVRFSADRLVYDSVADIVIAEGHVEMSSEGDRLFARRIVWNRATGEVRAEGDVRVQNPGGDRIYGDSVVLTDELRDGAIENMLLVLDSGGRLAAERATLEDGVITLYRAAYSPCPVVDDEGCGKEPSWQINAVKVVRDPARNRIRYENASLELFGIPIVALPVFTHPEGGSGGSGLLVPDLSISRSNGVELSLPYYWQLAPDRDLTLTPHVYSDVLPMLEGEYRALTGNGAYRVRGYVTYGSRIPLAGEIGFAPIEEEGMRGYLEGNGRFQLSPEWQVRASGRVVTDRTFLRRYDISNDTRLRSVAEAERITRDSYVSIAGWAFQGLRATDDQGLQPIVLPAIDARLRLDDPFFGGRLEARANSLAIFRTEGQDSRRAFASLEWERQRFTPWGQRLTLTAFARGDVYHSSDRLLAVTPSYAGAEGWQGRFIGALAADAQWPLIGEFLGGTQILTPRVQIAASLPTENLAIPNEDARAVELEDSNLFALNRFPGHDRWEDGTRITYGVDWAVDIPNIAFRTSLGQSYRLDDKETIFPDGTGLAERFSDVVGRSTLKVGRAVGLVHRFRLDKDDLKVRRNEIDLVLGSRRTYLLAGYLRLNRDISAAIEDLGDREEARLGGRVAFGDYWSVFGSAIVDLTDRAEDPLSDADGYEPIRHRLGFAYDDECLELGISWRRDYDTSGDFRRGNTFLFQVALKNLGR
ncbi:MAG: LPS-assembly protein LptD [Sphingomonadaceae bacterium]